MHVTCHFADSPCRQMLQLEVGMGSGQSQRQADTHEDQHRQRD